ncbi:MAG: hypothetical protein ACR2HH_04565 [Chthoniobacterales bacterium]
MKNTKNTYSLLVESEEKGRAIFESSIYGLVLLCMAFTGWQFASSSVALPRMPATSNSGNAPVEMVAKAPVEKPVVIVSRG